MLRTVRQGVQAVGSGFSVSARRLPSPWTVVVALAAIFGATAVAGEIPSLPA